ncbi:MAG: PAS domain S-box protein, partial [Pseudonocardiaceae bacterium]
MNSPDQRGSLVGLARAWSDAMSPTAEVPLPDELIEEYLLEQLDRLIDVLGQAQFCPESATEVGVNLVAQGFTGERCLGRTVELLGHALLGRPELHTVDGLAGKVVSLLGALTSGYVAALRRRTLTDRGAWFREVFDSAPVGMVLSRLDGTVTEANAALIEILRHPLADLAGRDIGELFHPDGAESLRAVYQALTDGKRGRFQRRATALTARGDSTGVALTVSLLRDPEGIPTHHVTIVEDVA